MRSLLVTNVASYWLAPGEVANVTLRVFAETEDNLHPSRVGLYISSEACNTGAAADDCSDQPFAQTNRDFDISPPVLSPPNTPINISGVEAEGPDGAVVTFTGR